MARFQLTALNAALLVGTVLSSASFAQTPSVELAATQQSGGNINIAPDTLRQALREFTNKTGRQVNFDEALLAGKRSSGVVGASSASRALAAILANTGLTFLDDAAGVFTLRAVPAGAQRIEVLGTRLGREFTEASPVQVVSQEKAAQAGLLDSAAILRTQPSVSGPRSNLKFESNAFGTGKESGDQSLSLRGFEPNQTLLLLNGRRIVNSGSGGGPPSSPDLGMLPQSLVQSFEILTDGSSPIYGSDAIAGVINVKLRQNFDGETFIANASAPSHGGGRSSTVSLTSGKTLDRGFFGIAAELRQAKPLPLGKVRFFGLDCPSYYERDSTGQIRNNLSFRTVLPGAAPSTCQLSTNRSTGAFYGGPGFQTYFHTPGKTNTETPNFSLETIPSSQAGAFPASAGVTPFDSNRDGVINGDDTFSFLDGDGDGRIDLDTASAQYDFTRGPAAERTDYVAGLRTLNLFSYGQHEISALGNATAYFEASLSQRRSRANALERNLDASVSRFLSDPNIRLWLPASNPTNPCGTEAGGCFDTTITDGATGAVTPQKVATEAYPIIRFANDASQRISKIDLVRLVGGLKGDIGALNGFGGQRLGLNNWNYDVSFLYSRSQGSQTRRGVLADKLSLAWQTTVRDPSGNLVCGTDADGDGQPDDPTSCVPVNTFTDAFLSQGTLTRRETDFLFGELKYRSNVDLGQFTAVASGEAFRLPAGPMSWVFGVESRQDRIDAFGNDNVQKQNFASLLFDFVPSAKGSRLTNEVFVETGALIFKDVPFVKKLQVAASGRYSRVQNSGNNSVYSVRVRHDINDWLALRATQGTSFRSPGVYEQFRQGITLNRQTEDPCLAPFAAVESGLYEADKDNRPRSQIDRCRSDGLDPSRVWDINTLPSTDLIYNSGQSSGIDPETSTARTAGVVLSLDNRQLPDTGIFKDFSLNLAVTYYDIILRNRIGQADPDNALGECYLDGGDRRACARIQRDADGYLARVEGGFLNGRGRQNRGVDVNLTLQKAMSLGERRYRGSLSFAANYENTVRDIFPDQVENLSGNYDYPKLKGNLTAQLQSGEWIGTWYMNYVGSAKNFNFDPSEPTVTCLPTEAPITCSGIDKLDSYRLHNVSVGWQSGGSLLSFGVNNVFNVKPPRVGGLSSIASQTNTRDSGNYDVFGRTLVLQYAQRF